MLILSHINGNKTIEQL